MTEPQFDERLACALAQCRVKAGLSQADLAKKVGLSRRTVQSYESMESYPRFSKLIRWFYVCHQNPVSALLSIVSPSMDVSSDVGLIQRIETALNDRVKSLTDSEKRGILFILSGKHGSSVYAFIQLCVAYLHCPMHDRQLITSLVINAYQNAEEKGNLVCPDEIRPDLTNLSSAYEAGRKAYINDQDSYFTVDFTD